MSKKAFRKQAKSLHKDITGRLEKISAKLQDEEKGNDRSLEDVPQRVLDKCLAKLNILRGMAKQALIDYEDCYDGLFKVETHSEDSKFYDMPSKSKMTEADVASSATNGNVSKVGNAVSAQDSTDKVEAHASQNQSRETKSSPEETVDKIRAPAEQMLTRTDPYNSAWLKQALDDFDKRSATTKVYGVIYEKLKQREAEKFGLLMHDAWLNDDAHLLSDPDAFEKKWGGRRTYREWHDLDMEKVKSTKKKVSAANTPQKPSVSTAKETSSATPDIEQLDITDAADERLKQMQDRRAGKKAAKKRKRESAASSHAMSGIGPETSNGNPSTKRPKHEDSSVVKETNGVGKKKRKHSTSEGQLDDSLKLSDFKTAKRSKHQEH